MSSKKHICFDQHHQCNRLEGMMIFVCAYCGQPLNDDHIHPHLHSHLFTHPHAHTHSHHVDSPQPIILPPLFLSLSLSLSLSLYLSLTHTLPTRLIQLFTHMHARCLTTSRHGRDSHGGQRSNRRCDLIRACMRRFISPMRQRRCLQRLWKVQLPTRVSGGCVQPEERERLRWWKRLLQRWNAVWVPRLQRTDTATNARADTGTDVNTRTDASPDDGWARARQFYPLRRGDCSDCPRGVLCGGSRRGRRRHHCVSSTPSTTRNNSPIDHDHQSGHIDRQIAQCEWIRWGNPQDLFDRTGRPRVCLGRTRSAIIASGQ